MLQQSKSERPDSLKGNLRKISGILSQWCRESMPLVMSLKRSESPLGSSRWPEAGAEAGGKARVSRGVELP